MIAQASAPGKLMLLGEYAVLDGAPALVAAVDRRVRVTIGPRSPGADAACDASTQSFSIRDGPAGLATRPARAGNVHGDALPRFVIERLVEAGRLAPEKLDGLQINLDSGAFYRGVEKLGLGSSAAVTVATSAALMQIAGDADADPGRALGPLIELHAGFQHGRGSGADVAASLFGGLITFERDVTATARVERMRWPAGLCMLCLWSGRGAATGPLLRDAERARAARPAGHARHVAQLCRLARAGCDAAGTGDVGRLLAAIADYAEALDGFGRACGIDIVSPEHRRLGRLAAEAGAVYKPSGAGGGDIGVAFAAGEGPLAALRASAARDAFEAVELAIDHRGLDAG